MKFQLLILIALLGSCTTKESQLININHKVNKHIKFNSSKELDVNVNFRNNVSMNTDIIRVFNDTVSAKLNYCTCVLDNGIIEIKISKNSGFVGEDLIIKADDTFFYMTYDHFGDISSEHFQAYPIKQELEINTSDFAENNILIGKVLFKGIGFCESITVPKFMTQLEGKFKCRIRNK